MQVLIVEDDFLIASDLEIMLNDLGYTDVHIAYDVREAEKILEGLTPDFAILDMNLGAQLVFPIASKLLERRVAFVFSPCRALNTFPAEWRSHPVIPKPLEQHLLIAALTGFGIRNSDAR